MAGIGEAAAILGVAQLGFSLARALNSLIGDCKDARPVLTRMGAEIESTSLAMDRLGELAKKGRLYGDRGILEAASLANRYSDAIEDIRAMLKKKNKAINPSTVSPDEMELSSFQKFQFAFLRPRLEIAQLEVSRIKADLTLTYLSMIALTGETEVEKQKAAAEIPAWTRTLEWANSEYNKAVNRQRSTNAHFYSTNNLEVPHYITASRVSMDRALPRAQSSRIQNGVDPEHLKKYIEWAQREQAEAYRQAEEVRMEALRIKHEKELKEGAARDQAIAERAIREYEERKQNEALELIKREKQQEEAFVSRLRDARVPEEEIKRILGKKPIISTSRERSDTQAAPVNHLKVTTDDGKAHPDNKAVTDGFSGPQSSLGVKSQRLSHTSSIPLKSQQQPQPQPQHQGSVGKESPTLEAWCIDQGSQSRFCTPLDESWLENFVLGSTYKRASRQMWKRYAHLHAWCRRQINDIFEEKARDRDHKWSMISLQRTKPTRLSLSMRRSSKDDLVQLILIRTSAPPAKSIPTRIQDDDDLSQLRSVTPSSGQGSHERVDGNKTPLEKLVEPEYNTSNVTEGDNEATADIQDRHKKSPTKGAMLAIIEVFQFSDDTFTIVGGNCTNGTRLESKGYSYIETDSAFVISSELSERELEDLVYSTIQTVGVVTYGRAFQDLSAATRTEVRIHVKRDLLVHPMVGKARFVHIGYMNPVVSSQEHDRRTIGSPQGTKVSVYGTARPYHRVPTTSGETGPVHDTRSSLSKRTRFTDEAGPGPIQGLDSATVHDDSSGSDGAWRSVTRSRSRYRQRARSSSSTPYNRMVPQRPRSRRSSMVYDQFRWGKGNEGTRHIRHQDGDESRRRNLSPSRVARPEIVLEYERRETRHGSYTDHGGHKDHSGFSRFNEALDSDSSWYEREPVPRLNSINSEKGERRGGNSATGSINRRQSERLTHPSQPTYDGEGWWRERHHEGRDESITRRRARSPSLNVRDERGNPAFVMPSSPTRPLNADTGSAITSQPIRVRQTLESGSDADSQLLNGDEVENTSRKPLIRSYLEPGPIVRRSRRRSHQSSDLSTDEDYSGKRDSGYLLSTFPQGLVQSDVDITAMQLAKYTGSTVPAPALIGSHPGNLKPHHTYVEDAGEDDKQIKAGQPSDIPWQKQENRSEGKDDAGQYHSQDGNENEDSRPWSNNKRQYEGWHD